MRRIAPIFGVVAAIVLLAGCEQDATSDSAPVAQKEAPALMCGANGQLATTLYGAIEVELAWNENDLECSGMPRPEGRGARLRFSGPAGADQSLAFIIAIPDLERETQSAEFSSNVTLIEEGAGRFFSTPDLNNCLTEVHSVEANDESGDRYTIDGALYCVDPLPEVNGPSSVSIPELTFTGLLDWSAS